MPPKWTQQQAEAAFSNIKSGHASSPESWVERFVNLGLIEIVPPPATTPLEKLEHQLRLKYFSDNNISDLKMALGVAGLEIVEKTKR